MAVDPKLLERQNRRGRRQARYGPNFNLNDATPEQMYAMESDRDIDFLPGKPRDDALIRLALRTGGTGLPEGWTTEMVEQAFPPVEALTKRPKGKKRDLYIGNTGKKRPVRPTKLPGKPSAPNAVTPPPRY